jgi:sodium/bile acid cotransporter 7
MIQLYNFAFIPIMAKILTPYYPDLAFRDGLLALSVLPCTINICVAQTLAAGGNMGTAIFNAIFANVMGVFLTPLLAVWIMGTGKGVSLLSTLRKLGDVVIVPLVLGQILRYTPVGKFAESVTGYSRTLSSLLL